MKILALDTSDIACSVALWLDQEITELHKVTPLQQAQNILPLIEEILLSKKIILKQLDAIAFGSGPGSFTGARIAASVTQGLAYALDLPVIPISSLAALAQAAYQDLGWKNLLVGMDARIQEIYWAAYKVNQEGLVSLIGKEEVSKPEQVAIPRNGAWFGVGNAWKLYPHSIPYRAQAVDASRMPMASAIARLAASKYLNHEWLEPADALPVYLRDDVAKKSGTLP